MAEPKPYTFSPRTAFGRSNVQLENYLRSIPAAPSQAPDLVGELEKVDPYRGYDWRGATEELMQGYRPPTYAAPDYIAPTPYERTNFDFAGRYQAPTAYQGYRFQTPEIGELERVRPISDQIWDLRRTEADEDVINRYRDIRQRARDELIRTGKRPEQAGAVMANLDIEEEKAKREEERRIAIEKANQGLGIAQQEQALGLQRGTAQAGLEAETQEREAQELAKTYGFNIDAARYLVDQYRQQEEAQAGERQFAYGADAAEAARRYNANVDQARYAYDIGTEAERYRTGIEQWGREQEATEKEKEQLSKYSRAQDVASAKQTQWGDTQGAKIDRWNALMQGVSAGQTGAAQEATYWTNLSQKEREKALEKASPASTVASPGPSRPTGPMSNAWAYRLNQETKPTTTIGQYATPKRNYYSTTPSKGTYVG